jgi:alpha-galactosidase
MGEMPTVNLRSGAEHDLNGFFMLRGGGALVALEARVGARPVLLYCGPDLPGATPDELSLLAAAQHIPGGPATPQRASLAMEAGSGHLGPAGLVVHRDGTDWALDLRVTELRREAGGALVVECIDSNAAIGTAHWLRLDHATGILTARTTLTNHGDGALQMDWCASLCVPLDPRLTCIKGFTGRWAGEFQTEDVAQFRGSYVRENRSGRTSHASFPGLILTTSSTDEDHGLAAGFHLAWSGNHRLRVDQNGSGQTHLQMGDLPLPGEIRLGAGESYETPELLACWSNAGIGAVSRAFHRYLSDAVLDPRTRGKPRPVHYNTWEAVYFNHDPAVLIDLADRAAAVGAERFVLDDGWFGGRRSDAAGLGDWWVSPDIYPDGLHPLIDRVRLHSMEFGLWFEPEMVNPDSELYRAHPDWVLSAPAVEHVVSRNQMTLDLTRGEVFDYLFEKVDALVSAYAIDYIKWDMNRDTHHPRSAGRAVMHRQTRAVYRLMQQLRARHPGLEIESCSSGGARADFGVMRHCDRIWTSDNNDARDRQAIQRGASYFFPLRVLGHHVGPQRCHITGRQFPMAFRVGSAMFGHMGMELDPRAESASDLAILAAGIALHKQHRALMHDGDFYRLVTPDGSNAFGCIATDAGEALFSYAQIDAQRQASPAPIFLRGLDPGKRYRTRLVWPQTDPSLSSPSIIDAARLMGDGAVFSGAALMQHGILPPLTYPDTCLIYHLKAEV